MKLSRSVSLFLASSLFLSPLALAKKFDVDPAHSTLGFEASHLKVSRVPGRFGEFTGSVDWDEKDFTKSKIDFSVDVASITTHVDKRDEHLRSPDFFDAAKFPKATFKNAKIVKAGSGFKMTGDLTIRGVTKATTFDVQNHGKVNDPVMKTDKYVFSAKSTINRRDFGVNYGTDAIVGDQVDLWINLETIPAPAK